MKVGLSPKLSLTEQDDFRTPSLYSHFSNENNHL